MLAHNVFFSLKDNSPEACQAMVESCKKYLTDHPGQEFFACGSRNPDLVREEVNDLDFDVSLHIYFDTKENQDLYQDADRHLEFIEANKDLWSNVRVFDSDC